MQEFKYKISVIIPVYNTVNYLQECLDSLIEQSLRDWEAILIDDGSTDSSESLCDEYAKKIDTITVRHQQNRGQAAARNVGIDAASGKYIMFLDSDDILAKDALKVLFDNAEKHNADIVKGKISHFDDGCVIPVHAECSGKTVIHDSKNESFYSDITAVDEAGSPCAQLYLKAFMDSSKIRFNPGIRFCEDTPFGYTTLLLAHTVVYVDLPVYYYRIRKNSTTTTSLTQEQIESTIFIFKEILGLTRKLGDKCRFTMVYWQILNWFAIIMNSAPDKRSYFNLIKPLMNDIADHTQPSWKYILAHPLRSYLLMADYGVRHNSFLCCLASARIWLLLRKINTLRKKILP